MSPKHVPARFITLLLLVFSGCGKEALRYSPGCCVSIKPSGRSTSSFVKHIEVVDRRRHREIDKSVDRFAFDTIVCWLQNDLRSTKLFSEVYSSHPDDGGHTKVDTSTVAILTLREMRWKVPDYKRKVTAISAASIGFGLIGGMVAGSIPTEVSGKASVSLRLVDASDSTVLWDGSVTSEYKTTKPVLDCDTRSTKALVAGSALRKALRQICQDLSDAIAANASPVATTLRSPREQPLVVILKNGRRGEGFFESINGEHLTYRRAKFGKPIKIARALIEHCIVDGDTLQLEK